MFFMRKLEKIVDYVMALLLILMGIFVFSNVVLRYFFNFGLTWAEELSRFLFVWMVFLGVVGALKDNNHLGFSSLVQRLSPFWKKTCYFVSTSLMVAVLAFLSIGSFKMVLMTRTSSLPATGLSLALMYGIVVISSFAMFFVVVYKLYKALFVKGAIDELVILKESEEEIGLEEKIAEGEIK